MHSFALMMTFATLTATIFICKVSAQTTAPPEERSVRLVNGANSSEGRLEVFYSDEWGTVCNNLWTLTQANVVCRQLGYLGADRVFYKIADTFGVGSDKIHFQSVTCNGSEDELIDCTLMPTGVSGTPCVHTEDIGIACTTTNSVRLTGGTRYGQGMLEMLSDTGEWGKVCAQDWSPEATRVACNQLGHIWQQIASTSYISDGPYVTGGLICLGNENRLNQCRQMDDWAPDTCQNGISISCSPDIVLGGSGAILVWYGDDIGSICPGDNFNLDAARVACRYLGHKDAIRTTTVESSAPFEAIIYNPTCSGDETFYTECESAQWAYHGNCISADDGRAGVVCERQEPVVRINNDSPYPEIGRVEISVAEPDEYRMVCSRAWNMTAAHVVCKKLGYDLGAVQIFPVEGSRIIAPTDHVITRLDCPELVSNLADCTIEITDFDSADDCDLDSVAGVACSAADNIVPLVGGSSTSEGVLEYKINGLPSLICDPDWSDKEASVACHMHGYETGNKSEVVSLGNGRESFPYIFQNYNYTCLGTEASLEECQAEIIGDIEVCDPDDIVQVTCQPNKDWDYRLVGSDASEQGRVEVFLDGEWGSVIHDRPFYNPFKDDICQKLGYRDALRDSSNPDAIGENPFGAGTGKVLRCTVTECEDVLSDLDADEARSEVNVICLPYGTVENHPIRLVSETGVANNQTGRVEILHDGVWGSVCDKGFSVHTVPRAVCKELGYNDLHYDRLDGQEKEPFITGDEMIWLTIVDSCYFESRLYECNHGPWGQNPEDCSPSVVTCVPDDDDDDPGDAGLSVFRARRTGLILGAVLIVLLIITV